jgi:hypothetical protein
MKYTKKELIKKGFSLDNDPDCPTPNDNGIVERIIKFTMMCGCRKNNGIYHFIDIGPEFFIEEGIEIQINDCESLNYFKILK